MSLLERLERPSFHAQRLSDVGIAVGQQITAKIGLKLPASQERIVEQTRWLYLRYVFVKLRQNKLPLRDLNLTKSSRARRAAALAKVPGISVSAPSTADATVEPVTLFVHNPRFSNHRKRTTMSGNIEISHDISLLAHRVSSFNLKRPTNSPSSTLEAPSNPNNSMGNSTRKHIMDPTINNQIFSVIINVIKELRDAKPEYFGDTIYEVIGIDKFSSLENLLEVQLTICQEMTRSEISWSRIIALFSLFTAMSLDCVRLGAPEHVGPILDGFVGFVERDLALWISQQGGWESFLYKHRPGFRFSPIHKAIVSIAVPVFIWVLFYAFK